jgi:hypothetical protein
MAAFKVAASGIPRLGLRQLEKRESINGTPAHQLAVARNVIFRIGITKVSQASCQALSAAISNKRSRQKKST